MMCSPLESMLLLKGVVHPCFSVSTQTLPLCFAQCDPVFLFKHSTSLRAHSRVLAPVMQARPFTARVVNVSSMTHFLVDGVDLGDPQLTKPGAYAHQRAYAQSKLAQVQFTAELRRRWVRLRPDFIYLLDETAKG